MPIYGIGIDLIEIKRIKESLKSSERFLKHLAHPKEKQIIAKATATQRIAEYWAGRFAAKEAFAKALGTGIGKTVRLSDVGVVQDSLGKPMLVCIPSLEKKLKSRKISKTHISITHTKTHASAVVVLEGS